MATFRYVIADVFTDTPLAGNQLAVFTDAREIPEADLQRLARETNFSETTFVYPPEGDGHVRMRIFTPQRELPFAGHPTLGTAFVLGGPLQLVEIRIETQRGVVPVQLEREGARITFGTMEQPLPTVTPFERTEELLSALGVDESAILDDYELSAAHYTVRQLARLQPRLEGAGIDLDRYRAVFGAPRHAMAGLLAILRERYGSIEGYLHTEAGVDTDVCTELRARLVEPRPAR